MKKTLLIIPIIIIVIGVIIIVNQKNNEVTEKFYLADKYYNRAEVIDIDASNLKKIEKENYLLFTYNNYCAFQIPCEDIFESFTKNENITILSMPFAEFKKTKYYRTVKYAPSVLIVKNGNVVGYLDAEKDEDIPKYQDVSAFTNWVSNYIYLSK